MAKFRVYVQEVTYVTKEIEIEVPDGTDELAIDKLDYDFGFFADRKYEIDDLIEAVSDENEFKVLGTKDIDIDRGLTYNEILGEDD